MITILSLPEITPAHAPLLGGKAAALAALARAGVPVPPAVAIGTDAYRCFLETAPGLRERIGRELSRKRFADMRWEEIWDVALRIRHLFLHAPLGAELANLLTSPLEAAFGTRPVAVRSSAPGEDSAGASFAGLHESYVNVVGAVAILEHVRRVWASLWSDRALLYRQELGLDPARSAMAVLIQELVAGECSGVVFSQSPVEPAEALVEAVPGLNQGLVDGSVPPDRWHLDRSSGAILRHVPAERTHRLAPGPSGVAMVELAAGEQAAPPLDAGRLAEVHALALRAEAAFGRPQDVEWTFRGGRLYALQSRPVTTPAGPDAGDLRPWYRTLHRSFENLRALRNQIEQEVLPAMDAGAAAMAAVDPAALDDAALADEIRCRETTLGRWEAVYWDTCIPFAHGMRLFGQVYNDRIKPSDPYEFMDLLGASGLLSLRRNKVLEGMAALLRSDAQRSAALAAGTPDPALELLLDEFLEDFSPAGESVTNPSARRAGLGRLLLEIAACPPRPPREAPTAGRRDRFVAAFPEEERAFAEALLDLARASYRLRDDDNLHLDRVRRETERAVAEGRQRLELRTGKSLARLDADAVAAALGDPAAPMPESAPDGSAPAAPSASVGRRLRIQPRQIVGQPAGPGLAAGPARVVAAPEDLFAFQSGEILVCDAIDPGMTFVVPLAAAVVERRGGMLIHGAIIAREYGLPCVTGVPDATRVIRTGARITVDGYLGIVYLPADAG